MPSFTRVWKQVEEHRSGTETEAVRSMFAQLQPVSVDYGIMEKTDRAASCPGHRLSGRSSWTA